MERRNRAKGRGSCGLQRDARQGVPHAEQGVSRSEGWDSRRLLEFACRLQLFERALPRGLIRTPSQELRPMTEASVRDVVVLDFTYQLRCERLKFAAAVIESIPSAGTAGRLACETFTADQRLQSFHQFQLLGCRK